MKKPSVSVATALLAALPLFTLTAAPALAGPGYALSFNGTNNHVSATIPMMANNYTVCAWVNLRSGGQWFGNRVAVLSSAGCGDSAEVLVHAPEDGSTSQRLFLGRCNYFNGTNSALTIPSNQWTHVAVTVSASQQVSYFINGVAAGTWDGAGVNCALGGNIMLAYNQGSGRSYNGWLDEVQVWSTARSQVEIQAGLNQSPNLADTNLVAYWPFNESAGPTAADASGQGHTGTLVNRPARVLSSVWTPQLRLNGDNPLTNECHGGFVDPGAVASASPVALAAGFNHSLALKADGTVVGWGNNDDGQITVPALATNVVAIAAGVFHSLALRVDGTVVGWGDNSYGQTTAPARATNVVSIAAGYFHNLALKTDGTVVAWGSGSHGQCDVPSSATNIVALAAGYGHSLALKADGTVIAWGAGWTNDPSNYTDYGQSIVPSAATNVVAIAAGYAHSLALKADGTVVAWGWNDSGQTTVPAPVTNVVAILGGDGHSLALKADGTVVGWGGNGYGQTNVPVAVTNVVALAGGGVHSLALKADGTVVGWGGNEFGQTTVPASVNVYFTIGVSGTVDANAPGAYLLTYSATNGAGVAFTNRTVVVVDTTAPVVGLLGSNPLLLVAGTPWVDPGATASDACAGDLTGSMLVTGAVDPDGLGSYTLTYAATDASGNSSTTNRTVLVCAPPSISGIAASFVTTNAVTGIRDVMLNASVNPNGTAATVVFEYGLTAACSGSSVPGDLPGSYASSNLVFSVGSLGPGYTCHWRVIASNFVGVTTTPDQTLGVPALYAPGDLNGDGAVSADELSTVQQNFWQTHPLQMTGLSGVGSGMMTLGVSNSAGPGFTVLASTNLVDWVELTNGLSMRYQINDPDTTKYPQRFYRLRTP
jgi:hypothetical protein